MVLFSYLVIFFATIILLIKAEENITSGIQAEDTGGRLNSLIECCEGLNTDGSSYNCSGMAERGHFDSVEAAVDAEVVPNKFLFVCLAKNKDYTNCCKGKNVRDECLPICNAANPPSDDQMKAIRENENCTLSLSMAVELCQRSTKNDGKERISLSSVCSNIQTIWWEIKLAYYDYMLDSLNKMGKYPVAGLGYFADGFDKMQEEFKQNKIDNCPKCQKLKETKAQFAACIDKCVAGSKPQSQARQKRTYDKCWDGCKKKLTGC